MLVELNDALLWKFVFASIPFLKGGQVSQKKKGTVTLSEVFKCKNIADGLE